ncbi:MAG: hypothetical protein HQL93_14195 [Magnetococcales bacterium]|nr:hypothetical protein [Magnetococcales bacterium]
MFTTNLLGTTAIANEKKALYLAESGLEMARKAIDLSNCIVPPPEQNGALTIAADPSFVGNYNVTVQTDSGKFIVTSIGTFNASSNIHVRTLVETMSCSNPPGTTVDDWSDRGEY